MTKENKIILTGAIVLAVAVIILAVVSSGQNSGSSSSTSTSTGFYEGEQTLAQLASISGCSLTGTTTLATTTASGATTTITLTGTDAFAECLTQKGFTMYGASWCPHCQQEKSYFGTSFKYIHYVECPDNTDLCIAKGVQGYPTWIQEK